MFLSVAKYNNNRLALVSIYGPNETDSNISLLSNKTFITSLKEYIKEFLEIDMPSDVDSQYYGKRLSVLYEVSVYLYLLLLPKRKYTSLHN